MTTTETTETVKVELTPAFTIMISAILDDSADYPATAEDLAATGQDPAGFDEYFAKLAPVEKVIRSTKGKRYTFTTEEAAALREEAEYRIDWAEDEMYTSDGAERLYWASQARSAKATVKRIDKALAA